MKKLVIMVLLAAYVVGCTPTSIEEDEYNNQIEAVDLSKTHIQGDKNSTGD